MKQVFLFLFTIFTWNCTLGQIPNYDFETWDSTAGYLMPVGWDNLNPVTTSSGVYTCGYDSPGYGGAYYLKITSQNIPGTGMVPGVAVCGKLNPATYLPVSGFPFTSRPQVLAGVWQYMAMSMLDQGYIVALLSKWNTSLNRRDTIAYARYNLPDMVMIWMPFHIALNYTSSAAPDSAIIYLSSSSAGLAPVANGSYIWVDDLRFTDSVTLGGMPIEEKRAPISIFPNPASGYCTIRYNSPSTTNADVVIYDIMGLVIFEESYRVNTGYNQLPLSTVGLSKGFYFVKWTDKNGQNFEKLIIE